MAEFIWTYALGIVLGKTGNQRSPRRGLLARLRG